MFVSCDSALQDGGVSAHILPDMDHIRLLSTDFDGTLIGHPGDGRCVPELAEALSGFVARGGLWAINTGRSLEHAVEGLQQFDAPVSPQFLLTNEREVFCRDAGSAWSDFGAWNSTCRAVHADLFSTDSGIFDVILATLPESADVTVIEESGHPVGVITADEIVMQSVVDALEPARRQFPDFSWQRNTIYLRFCHRAYHKGAALGELGRLTGIAPSETMAAGDHFNDLSMLCGTFASYVACPANAIESVKDAVRAVDGHVSDLNYGAGIAEALRAFHATK